MRMFERLVIAQDAQRTTLGSSFSIFSSPIFKSYLAFSPFSFFYLCKCVLFLSALLSSKGKEEIYIGVV